MYVAPVTLNCCECWFGLDGLCCPGVYKSSKPIVPPRDLSVLFGDKHRMKTEVSPSRRSDPNYATIVLISEVLFFLGLWLLLYITSRNTTMKLEKLCEKLSAKKLERSREVKRWRGEWGDCRNAPLWAPHMFLLPMPLWSDPSWPRRQVEMRGGRWGEEQ